METVLIFRLYGPFAAWGGVAVGEVRDSDTFPTRSALLGLLGAALGLCRSEEERLQDLGRALRFAVRVDRPGGLMQDYHTAQVPPRTALKHRPHRNRKDELDCPKSDLNTILSTRQYRVDAAYTILVSVPADPERLESLASALERPVFVPYLGRKSCTLAWPMTPRILQAAGITEAFQAYDRLERQAWEALADFPTLAAKALAPREETVQLAWDEDLPLAESLKPSMRVLRRDEPLNRKRWQFAERQEARTPWNPEQP